MGRTPGGQSRPCIGEREVPASIHQGATELDAACRPSLDQRAPLGHSERVCADGVPVTGLPVTGVKRDWGPWPRSGRRGGWVSAPWATPRGTAAAAYRHVEQAYGRQEQNLVVRLEAHSAVEEAALVIIGVDLERDGQALRPVVLDERDACGATDQSEQHSSRASAR